MLVVEVGTAPDRVPTECCCLEVDIAILYSMEVGRTCILCVRLTFAFLPNLYEFWS